MAGYFYFIQLFMHTNLQCNVNCIAGFTEDAVCVDSDSIINNPTSAFLMMT